MSDLTLVIGNKNYSSWSLRPWIFLRHFNIPFQEQRVALYTDSTKDALKNFRSNSKVPTLIDGDLEVWDSLAILEYLSENYANERGWPSDPRARAVARSLSAEMHSSFVLVRVEMPLNCRRRIEGLKLSRGAQNEIERIKWIWNYCRDNFAAKDNDQGWLFGKFSIADAMYIPVALRFYGYHVALDGFAKQYVENVVNHPAVQEWIKSGEQEPEIIDMSEIKLS